MWRDTRVLVTGGASFIGSHLVDALIQRGAAVTVADDFSSGRLQNLTYDLRPEGEGVWRADGLHVLRGDLFDPTFCFRAMEGQSVVFHLAAAHGGRGYIDTHPAECSSNMGLDQMVLKTAHLLGVERICYASSACVYPAYLQAEAGSTLLLREEDADPFVRDRALPDLEYGWAKFMGEMSLRAYHREYGMKTSAARIFTAYGPRENETHAIIALIARAFIHQDPFVVWGSGNQDRNFTYVEDIVEGLLRTCEVIEDGSPVNVGRQDRITINEAAEIVFDGIGWHPEAIARDITKPTGVASRAASLDRARRVLEWEPRIDYRDGFARTIDWYVRTKDPAFVRANLERLLLER